MMKKRNYRSNSVITDLLEQYVIKIQAIYGQHLRMVIMYGSYARGDYREDSDIDIMILVDEDDLSVKKYQNNLFDMTYDFNLDHDIEISPIAIGEQGFYKWVDVYPFYTNVSREGVRLYDAA
ncbi:MAG: nucleotidyltransferase domain-containing protein [Lachnospiraceae bacterium]|jgi:predicted nucleotidyltransferase|nr:nucleotidyltransferase domain-containing protein [Lachnospiraceae bacterium]